MGRQNPHIKDTKTVNLLKMHLLSVFCISLGYHPTPIASNSVTQFSPLRSCSPLPGVKQLAKPENQSVCLPAQTQSPILFSSPKYFNVLLHDPVTSTAFRLFQCALCGCQYHGGSCMTFLSNDGNDWPAIPLYQRPLKLSHFVWLVCLFVGWFVCF